MGESGSASAHKLSLRRSFVLSSALMRPELKSEMMPTSSPLTPQQDHATVSAVSAVSLLERAMSRSQALADQLDHDIGRVATLRFFAFVIGGSSSFAGWYDSAWELYAAPALIGWALFGAAMWRHRRLYALAPRAQLSAQEQREAIARLSHDWSALSDDGAEQQRGAHHERELQVFGEVSLYKLLNSARLSGGRARLGALLRGALLREEPSWEGEASLSTRLELRQGAAEELAARRSLRKQVSVEAQVGGQSRVDLEPLIRWAEGGDPLPSAWRWRSRLGLALVSSTWLQICLELSLELNTAWQLTLVAQLVLFALTTRPLSARYAPLLGEHYKGLEGLSRCFERLERARFESEGLSRWQAALKQGGAPSLRIAELSKTSEALAVKHSALLYGILSIGFCWELLYGVKAWRWRAEHGPRVRRDLELLYDWEALAAMGAHWADHEQLSWPELTEDPSAPLVEATQLNHPLFEPSTRRANDFKLEAAEGQGGLVLITGSNMSGKSSFMRSIGTNVTLAFAGAPVVADALRLRPLELATSVQVTDDPARGWSRFYAEVRRIREVIERAEGASVERPILYLIDEMLSGTNSRERRLASRAIAARLLSAPHAAGIITTHDLDLARLEELYPERLRCAHFSDVFDGERLIFDYQLREGVAQTTNALQVLWLEGIEVEGALEEPRDS